MHLHCETQTNSKQLQHFCAQHFRAFELRHCHFFLNIGGYNRLGLIHKTQSYLANAIITVYKKAGGQQNRIKKTTVIYQMMEKDV